MLEKLNYRFNPDSLMHHLRGYTSNRWDLRFQSDAANRVWVNARPEQRQAFNGFVRVCPSQAAFDARPDDRLAPRVQAALLDRSQRLAHLNGAPVKLLGDRIDFGPTAAVVG